MRVRATKVNKMNNKNKVQKVKMNNKMMPHMKMRVRAMKVNRMNNKNKVQKVKMNSKMMTMKNFLTSMIPQRNLMRFGRNLIIPMNKNRGPTTRLIALLTTLSKS